MTKWITVLTVSYPQQLWVIRTKLESEGIECFIKDELTVQSYNLYSNAVGGVKLQVFEEDVEKARTILTQLGYIKDEPFKPDLLSRLEKTKSLIPFLKKVNLGYGITIIILLLVALVTTLSYFILRPSISEQLTHNPWCVNKIYYKQKIIGPKTTGLIVTMVNRNGDTACYEKMELQNNHSLALPGVNSAFVEGRWEINDQDKLIITVGSQENIYKGIYDINISESSLVLKSPTTVIYAQKDNFNIQVPF